MSKLKLSKASKKQQESLPKDLKKSGEVKPSQSPQENISVNPLAEAGNEFQKDILKSKTEIAEAEQKSTRGRKKLPRDAQGNIIRPDSPQPVAGSVAPVNPQAIEENKQILRLVFPAVNSLATKRALSKEPIASDEEITILVDSGAVILEKYMPAAMSTYGMEIVFLGTLGKIAYKMEMNRRSVLEAERKAKQNDSPATPKQ